MKREVLYRAAAYVRLSREDGDMDGGKKEMSSSIASQRDMIGLFLQKQPDIELFDVYVDDGYSGANFDRPAFRRMLADIEAGHVNCVIVKDLSRFGRDYIEAGRFIQKTFPAFSVRFISLTDRYDSLTADRNTTSLVIPVKNFINDSYCRDISQKVKSHQRVKREQGKFIGAFAVYGYRKDTQDKNKLVPDGYAAGIVRIIFAWKLDGWSSLAIANRLNELGVLSPLEYKKSCGTNFATGFRTGLISRWSAVAVKRILINELYTGTMVQGKREKVNYKVPKTVNKPRDQWVKAEGAHEAIISYEDYRKVQKLLEVDVRAANGEAKAHMFSGLLFCKDCKKAMVRRKITQGGRETVSYICSTHNRGKGCTRHRILEEALSALMVRLIQEKTAPFFNSGMCLKEILEAGGGEEPMAAQVYREKERLTRERESCKQLLEGLEGDLKRKVITPADFHSFRQIFERQYEGIQAALAGQEKMEKEMACARMEKERRLKEIKRGMGAVRVDRRLLLSLVDRIEVFEDRKILVKFCFREEFQMPGGDWNGG